MIQNAHLQSMIRKENLFQSYIKQARLLYEISGLKHTEEECIYLQKAADLQSEMAQITTGYERETHQMKLEELNRQIETIYRQINPEKLRRMKEEKEKKQKDESGSAADKKTAAAKAKESELDATVRTWYKEAPKHGFEDVSGMSALKKKLQSCLTDMKMEKLAKFLKIKPLTSYFFVGPPGCGKTFIIEAFAHELMDKDFKYLYLTGSDIISRYVGDAEKIVTRLFREAAENAPCIVFIDEIDSVCKNRSLPALPEYAANITTSFLTGYNYINNSDKKIIFIGATNYPKRVDSAMLDRVEVIRVDLPDFEARKSAFDRHFQDMLCLEPGFTTDDMAKMTEGYNYRDIDKVVETLKRIIFEEFSTGGQSEDAAIARLMSGTYLLTREKFLTAFRAFKPANKSDIIDDINDWERDLKAGNFEGTVNLRADEEPEETKKPEPSSDLQLTDQQPEESDPNEKTVAPEQTDKEGQDSDSQDFLKKIMSHSFSRNESDETDKEGQDSDSQDFLKKIMSHSFSRNESDEMTKECWPVNDTITLERKTDYAEVCFRLKDKALQKICANVDGYTYICQDMGDSFLFRYQPREDVIEDTVTITSEKGIVGDFVIHFKRALAVSKEFQI